MRIMNVAERRDDYNSKCTRVIKDKEDWKNIIRLGGWRGN